MLVEDGVEALVLGNRLEGDMRDGLVVETGAGVLRFVGIDAFADILGFVSVELGGEETLAGDSNGDAGAVDGDPAAAPSFCHIG